MKDYEKVYEDFWKEIVENEDGTLNLDQVKRELSDYASAMDLVSTAYSRVTGDRISKLLTDPAVVYEEAERHFNIWAADAVLDVISDLFETDQAVTKSDTRRAVAKALDLKESDL